MTAQPLLQFGTVTLNPAPDRRVIGLQTALGEQLFDIAERERVAKIPAPATKNPPRRRLPPLEDCRSGYVLHDLFRLPATPAKVATHPFPCLSRHRNLLRSTVRLSPLAAASSRSFAGCCERAAESNSLRPTAVPFGSSLGKRKSGLTRERLIRGDCVRLGGLRRLRGRRLRGLRRDRIKMAVELCREKTLQAEKPGQFPARRDDEAAGVDPIQSGLGNALGAPNFGLGGDRP